MKISRIVMGMPAAIEIRDKKFSESETVNAIEQIFLYFDSIDQKFSTYKEQSEISKINRGEVTPEQYSAEMREVMALSENIKQQTMGYFDIQTPSGKKDPSGLVKGWAINNAAKILREQGFEYFLVEIGGDIQVNTPIITTPDQKQNDPWQIGIRNPFNSNEIIKVVSVQNEGVATSGTSARGAHIYNPVSNQNIPDQVISITVVGSNIYEADCFATAAFAMGIKGIEFIEKLQGFEAYQIDKNGSALITSVFKKYILNKNANA